MKTRFFLLATLLYICQAASAVVPSLSLIPLPEHMAVSYTHLTLPTTMLV